MTDSSTAIPLDLPNFDPVPTARRHDGWTPDRQRQYIASLALLGSVSAACRAMGMSRMSAYKLRDRPDAVSFAAAWDFALQMGRDRVWERAIDRAINGYTRPVRRGGVVVGERRLFDHRLIATIPARHPSARRVTARFVAIRCSFVNFAASATVRDLPRSRAAS